MIPGEYVLDNGDIAINTGRASVTLVVANSGDRPIQVGSHFHFFEVNTALQFGRSAAIGMRLNIAAGTAVRFEPGQQRTVELVALAGARRVFGRRQEQPLVLPLAFLALMAAGALLQGALVVGEAAILASLAAIGLLLAARVPKWSAVAMVGLFGVLHGQVHGHELPGLASAAGYLSASAALLGAGLIIGRFRRWPRPLVDLRRGPQV